MGDNKIDKKNADAFSGYAQDLALVKTHAEQQKIPEVTTAPSAPGESLVSSYDLGKAPILMRMGRVTEATFRETPYAGVTTKSATYTLKMLSGTECTLTLTTSVYAGGEVVSGANSSCKSQDGAVFSSLTADLAHDVGQAFDALRKNTGSPESVLAAHRGDSSKSHIEK